MSDARDPAGPGRPTRRQFLAWLGAAGGAGAVAQGALALGLLPGSALASATSIAPLDGRKRRVALLGGGLSSLAAAYELERAGYECIVLEASDRIGGRVLTIRSGDTIDEIGGRQTCTFDDAPHLYFNAGAARIPEYHELTLRYCRELKVALEPFIAVNHNGWVHDREVAGGRPVRHRHYLTDARGFLTELSTKAIRSAAFDASLGDEDLERLVEFLRAYGDLDESSRYAGSNRAGYVRPGLRAPSPGFIDHGELRPRLDFQEILRSSYWRARMHFSEFQNMTAPLMQPVGGMDRITEAFVAALASPIHTRAIVRSIQVRDDGVEIGYQRDGAVRQLRADYCFNAIPAHLLTGLDTNFPAPYRRALGAATRGKAMKVAFQMKERFWESEQIYGGITWTDQPIAQIWYPSHGIHQDKGIVQGAYTFFPREYDHFHRMSPDERVEAALAMGEQIHPDYRRHFECGVTVNWYRMNHHLGCAARWGDEDADRYVPLLQRPVNGRHFLIGDQVTYHTGWQEGALSSTHLALAGLQQRVAQEPA